MFADTCHSGGAYNSRVVNDSANANIVVFSATDTETLSWEFEKLAHGAFTYALIQGLEGKAKRIGVVDSIVLGIRLWALGFVLGTCWVFSQRLG